MKVFVDTNVLAAGFATRGLCSDLMREVLENHELFSSKPVLTELERILIKKFRIPKQEAQDILEFIGSVALLSEPDENASYEISDTDDIPHLSAAENSQCEVFVTGDKELWSVRTPSGMDILSPRDFWKAISAHRDRDAPDGAPLPHH